MSQNSLEDSLGNFNLQLSNAQAVVFLSYRVKKVFSLMGKDISNMEIVENLNISVQTVKNHVTSIMRKLEFNSRIQVALLSLQHNMLQETVVDTDFKPAEAASIDLPVR
jgi:DNA-binding NarL/FixJ family response regulator